MRRPPSIVTLLSTLLVVVAIFGAGSALAATAGDDPGTPHAVTTENDTVGRLTVPDGAATGESATADLSSALSGQQERLQSTLQTGQFRSAFESARNESAKSAVIDATLDRLEARAMTLRDQRQTAIQSFTRDEMTSSELFRELARIRIASEEINQQVAVLETVVQESSVVSLSDDATATLAAIDGEVITLQGPITARLTASLRGIAPPRSIGVISSESGAVLTAIDGGTFLREATLWSERLDSGANQFEQGDTAPLSRAYQQVQGAYPWAVENLVSGLSVTGFGESTVYAVELTHSHGDLQTYLDGRTTNVFYEVQQLQLSSLPTETVAANTTDGVLLEVNATAVGPSAVTVRNATTGKRVIAEITVETATRNRATIGSRLWLLETDETRTITARRPDGTTVAVTVGS